MYRSDSIKTLMVSNDFLVVYLSYLNFKRLINNKVLMPYLILTFSDEYFILWEIEIKWFRFNNHSYRSIQLCLK